MIEIASKFSRLTLITIASVLATACVAVVPTPGKTDGEGSQNTPATSNAKLCNIEGQKVQDLSDGTTKATITQSCQETVVFIENLHDKHPKRCRVSTGSNITELYIMPGDSRTLTQTGPVEQGTVQVGCVNDWNRTK